MYGFVAFQKKVGFLSFILLTTDWDLNCNEFSQIFCKFSPLWSIDQSIDLFGIIILNQVFYETGSVLLFFANILLDADSFISG